MSRWDDHDMSQIPYRTASFRPANVTNRNSLGQATKDRDHNWYQAPNLVTLFVPCLSSNQEWNYQSEESLGYFNACANYFLSQSCQYHWSYSYHCFLLVAVTLYPGTPGHYTFGHWTAPALLVSVMSELPGQCPSITGYHHDTEKCWVPTTRTKHCTALTGCCTHRQSQIEAACSSLKTEQS